MKQINKALKHLLKTIKLDLKLIDSKLIKISNLILFSIFLFAIIFRFFGQNWDEGFYLHPDERFILNATSQLKIPASIGDYLDPTISSLSPYNNNFKSFVYGTFPLTLTKVIASKLNLDNYQSISVVGRTLSAIFDIGTLLVTYLIARKFLTKNIAILATFLYAFNILAIQQSHFFTVDNFASFFMIISFYMLINLFKSQSLNIATIYICLSGVFFGLSLSSKASALLLLSVVFMTLGFKFFIEVHKRLLIIDVIKYLYLSILFVLSSYISLRFFEPYIFNTSNIFDLTLSKTYLEAVDFQNSLATGKTLLPFTYQWYTSQRFVSPLINLIVYGFGILSALVALLGIFYRLILIKHIFKDRKIKNYNGFILLIVVLWILIEFLYNAGNFMRYLRYFLPIIPFICIICAYMLFEIRRIHKTIFSVLFVTMILSTLIWTFAFIHIYTQDNTRVSSSKWIYSYIPSNSHIAVEAWDDSLPLNLNAVQTIQNQNYSLIQLDVYDPDNQSKLESLYSNLQNSDYLVLSSARGSGSIGKLNIRFPYMSKFYDKLDSESIGFKILKDFRVHPSLFGLDFNDESSEESFTVYDHPVVKIYQKVNSLTLDQFRQILIQ